MKILISLSGDVPHRVLAKMIDTINSDAERGSGIFTNKSCYGRVAHYLRNNWEDSWQILMYGEHYVIHCCLYSHSGKKIVDTFNGTPGPVYTVDGDEIPLLAAIPLHTIKSAIERFKL
jgi:hypothetical protein